MRLPAASWRWSIGAQLVALVAAALMPLIAFVAWSIYDEHGQTQRRIRATALDEAMELRANVDSHLHFVEGVLASVAPLAAREKGAIPDTALAALSAHLPIFVRSIRVSDAAGRLTAAVPPVSLIGESIASRPYFEKAMRTRRLVLSESHVARRSGRPLIVGALAYADPAGQPLGVISLSTDAEQFRARLFDKLAERKLSAAILSDAGEAIMVSEGAPPLETLRRAVAAARSEGAGEIDGLEDRTYAVLRATRAPWSIVVITNPEMAERDWNPYYNMLAAAVIALALAIAAAVLLSRRITRPLALLSRAAETFGRGELGHRVPMAAGEAGEVAQAFNSMAEQLEAQRATIRADAGRFRAVFHSCPLPMMISDLATGAIVEVNAAFVAFSGKSAAEANGRSTRELGLWFDERQRDRVLEALREHGRIQAFECRHRVATGGVADILMFAELVSIAGRRMIVSTCVDVTERKETERRLKEVSKRLTLATRSARIGIWNLDLRTRHLHWDDTMLDLYGITPREFDARFEDWLVRVMQDDRSQVERCRRAPSGDLDIQYRIVRNDGAIRYMRTSASVELDEQGTAARLTGTTRDVTETVVGREAMSRANSELEARVIERTGALQETVRELEAFSYTVAHDLRAPLRAIDGFSTYLERSLDDEKAVPTAATELLGKIRRNVGCMDRLIDGLLNYARLGRQAFRSVPVDMTALAEQVRAQMLDAHTGAKIVIDPLPPAVGDPDMLRQVWANLIGNACKFSRGREAPRIAVGSTTDAKGTTYFVWDNGVGFEMRYSDRLFRVFERLHTEAEYGGAGVGLALVQRVVQRHSGQVWAEGYPGEGATFYFRLPGAKE